MILIETLFSFRRKKSVVWARQTISMHNQIITILQIYLNKLIYSLLLITFYCCTVFAAIFFIRIHYFPMELSPLFLLIVDWNSVKQSYNIYYNYATMITCIYMNYEICNTLSDHCAGDVILPNCWWAFQGCKLSKANKRNRVFSTVWVSAQFCRYIFLFFIIINKHPYCYTLFTAEDKGILEDMVVGVAELKNVSFQVRIFHAL